MTEQEQSTTTQTGSRLYPTVGHAIADPTSNLSRFMANAREIRKSNDAVIDRLIATGLTREQAWTEALKTCRPVASS